MLRLSTRLSALSCLSDLGAFADNHLIFLSLHRFYQLSVVCWWLLWRLYESAEEIFCGGGGLSCSRSFGFVQEGALSAYCLGESLE